MHHNDRSRRRHAIHPSKSILKCFFIEYYAFECHDRYLNTICKNTQGIKIICVLLTYNHVGLVYEGYKHFNNMRTHYCIILRMKHYTCIIKLLRYARYVNEDFKFI